MLSGKVGCYSIIRELRHRELGGSPEITQPNPEQRWLLYWSVRFAWDKPLLGIKWDCVRALGRAFWTGLQSQGEGVMLDREAEAGGL